MRSKDIADRAGVTVRTLRHYHRISLLPEPTRDANGYRRYGIQHLVRLLRIKRLTGFGLSLGELPTLLKTGGDRQNAILDQLDNTIAAKIGRLQDQRRIVTELRRGGGPIDISVELATATVPLEAGRADRACHAGREQSALLDSILTDDGRRDLAELYERLATPPLAEIVRNLGQRFDRLGPGSTEADIVELADAYLLNLGPWMREYNSVMARHASGNARLLIWTHAVEVVGLEQRRLLDEIGTRLAARA